VNENHKRRIAITFRHVDGLLREALEALSGHEIGSPFSSIIPDAVPVQHRVIADYVARLHGVMVRALSRLGILAKPPEVPATRVALTNFMTAEIDIEEIDPRRMGGYGTIPAEDARALADTNAEILAILGQMSQYLRTGTGASLEARLAQLEPPEGLALLLREMTRIITEQGLVTLRPSLERLVEEAESGSFEIAVFGRVSSGKSSLLNRVLGRNVLPVGVTPVTALVTRIVRGPEERVTVRFATERARSVSVETLADYVTEQGNPANHKQVTSVQIELPGNRLQDSVTFVDTPGLGSLASSGAAETMAYLPRADLGVLLTDASAGLAAADVHLAETLLRAGARVMVVLSKVDLLAAEDRRRVQDYVTAHLATELGCPIPVHLVSAIGPDASLADHWFEAELRPLFGVHRKQRAQSLARKAEGLRKKLLGILQGKARTGTERIDTSVDSEQAFREIEGLAERAMEECHEQARLLSLSEDRILQRMVSGLPRNPRPDEARARLAENLETQVRETHDRIVAVMKDTREAMLQALGEAAGNRPGTLDLPVPYGFPIFDGTAVTRGFEMREPLLGFLHPTLRKKGLHAWIRAQTAPALSDALQFHRRCLDGWCREFMAELGQEFQVQAGPSRAPGEGQLDLSSEARMRLERDIQALEALGGDPGEAP
jgi:GTP-binding protein EngB required for normal cell division